MRAPVIILLFGYFTITHSSRSKPYYDLDEAENHFKNFIEKHKKMYSDDEKQTRFEIFKQNLKTINDQNYLDHAVYDVNKFSDLTAEEYEAIYTGQRLAGEPYCKHFNGSDVRTNDAPNAFDWRTKHVVTPVKDQGKCGACWAFCTIANIESQYAIKTGKLVSLSEQQLVDCDTTSNGCHGGNEEFAIEYLSQVGGLETEEEYPYEGIQGTCKFNASKIAVRVDGCDWYNMMNDEDKVRELIYKIGPLMGALDERLFRHYTGGVIRDCECKRLDHGVVIVGYGTEDGVPYWIIKNSYGQNIGEDGFIKIERGINCLGIMYCGMMTAKVVV